MLCASQRAINLLAAVEGAQLDTLHVEAKTTGENTGTNVAEPLQDLAFLPVHR